LVIDLASPAFRNKREHLSKQSEAPRLCCAESSHSATKFMRAAHSTMSDETELEPSDFHLAVKRRDYTAAPWRWEIWAAGKTRAVAHSERHFATMSEAMKQGKAALRALLQKKFPNAA
jgi:hypothetical protein